MLVIIGASAIVKKTILAWQPVIRDLLFYALSIILLIVAFLDMKIDIYETITFVVLYVVYVFAVIKWRKILPYKDEIIEEQSTDNEEENDYKGWKIITKPFDFILKILFPKPKFYVPIFIISILIIAGLSLILVESAISISDMLNIPKAIIALTVLAVGTSIPDLISSVLVAKQGRGGMAISNAFGSNIFDILIGLGVPWLITLSIFSFSGQYELSKDAYESLSKEKISIEVIEKLKPLEGQKFKTKEIFFDEIIKIIGEEQAKTNSEIIAQHAGNAIIVGTDSLFISSIILFGTVFIVLILLLIRKWRIGFGTGIFFISLYILYVIWEIIKPYILN